jgi:hypothetical protein
VIRREWRVFISEPFSVKSLGCVTPFFQRPRRQLGPALVSAVADAGRRPILSTTTPTSRWRGTRPRSNGRGTRAFLANEFDVIRQKVRVLGVCWVPLGDQIAKSRPRILACRARAGTGHRRAGTGPGLGGRLHDREDFPPGGELTAENRGKLSPARKLFPRNRAYRTEFHDQGEFPPPVRQTLPDPGRSPAGHTSDTRPTEPSRVRPDLGWT